jgi:hypothetical protein
LYPILCSSDAIVCKYVQVACGIWFKGVAGSVIQVEMAKLKNLSTLSKEDLLEAFRCTFCYRRTLIELQQPSFLELVEQTPCYLTLPQVAVFHALIQAIDFSDSCLGAGFQHVEYS